MAFEIDCSASSVQFWSDVRLPFEPKGDARAARDALRCALHGLAPTGELIANYRSVDLQPCDVENVLIYNVGPSHFARLSAQRLRLDRSFDAPRVAPSGRQFSHHHRYSAGGAQGAGWRRQRLVGERGFALPTSFRTSTVWAAARAVAAADEEASDSGHLALDVSFSIGASSRLRLPSSMKALLDGVVASFHRHDGSGDSEALIGLLSRQVGSSSVLDVHRLLHVGPDALGVRPLLRRLGKAIQWNPADDRLVAVDVSLARSEGSAAHCVAKLFDVAA